MGGTGGKELCNFGTLWNVFDLVFLVTVLFLGRRFRRLEPLPYILSFQALATFKVASAPADMVSGTVDPIFHVAGR